jgi:hypothetical protein
MSEYQFVHFLAIDKPLTDEQLEFMNRQSSRADISQWEFTNEYHYGSFRGKAKEMLWQGYDLHLHYANYGIRKLMIRLPAGLPCDRRTFQAFLPEYGASWHADSNGKGGILEIQPEADAGTYAEVVYELHKLLPRIAPVREALLDGDLRLLYLTWLACSYDEQKLEPPVPAGLAQLTPALEAVAELYEVSVDLIAAAAERSPALPKSAGADDWVAVWIAKRSKEELRDLVVRLLGDSAAAIRAETRSRIRDESGAQAWPMAEPTRTLAELLEAASGRGERRQRKAEQAAEAARRKQLADIAADPQKLISNVEKLVQSRSTANYERAAKELVDLQEALGPEKGPVRARSVAENLRRKNPKLNRLVGALRKHGLLDR